MKPLASLLTSLAASLSSVACGPPSPEPQPPNEPLIMRPDLPEPEAHPEARGHASPGTSASLHAREARAYWRLSVGLHAAQAARRAALLTTLLPHSAQRVCHSASPSQREQRKFPAIAVAE